MPDSPTPTPQQKNMKILLEFSPEVSVQLKKDVAELGDGDFAIFTRRAFALFAKTGRKCKETGGFVYVRVPGEVEERVNLLTNSHLSTDNVAPAANELPKTNTQ